MTYTVGIIGMGRIASGFDVPEGSAVTTHVKAILREGRLRLTHVADLIPSRARAEAERFGIVPAVVAPEVLLDQALDVLVIATPDGTHNDYARRANCARLVLIEKPLDGDAAARREVVVTLAAKDTTLIVNHQRRWIPGLEAWAKAALGGEFGIPLSVTAHYTRGFRHNAIHAVDLVTAFLDPKGVTATRLGDGVDDLSATDRTVTLAAQFDSAFGSVPALIVGVDGRKQTVFSVDIRFEKARVVIEDEQGINASLFRPHPVGVEGFADEMRLVERWRDVPPRLMGEVWRNIADHLELGLPLASAGADALAGYDLLDALAEAAA